jgi:hypothetical protein
MRYARIDWESSPARLVGIFNLDAEPQGIRIVNGNPVLIPVQEGSIPPHNAITQRVDRLTEITPSAYLITYQVADLTQEELDASHASVELASIDLKAMARVLRDKVILLEELTPEEIAELIGVYPPYPLVPGIWLAQNDLFHYDNQLYKVNQGHYTLNYVPGDPEYDALYTAIAPPGTVGDWVQPTGAHDAYALDDLVSWVGRVWRSLMNANVEEPGVLGTWRDQSDPPMWVVPVGSIGLWQTGDICEHVGKVWVSTMDNNHWEPGVFGWNEVVP